MNYIGKGEVNVIKNEVRTKYCFIIIERLGPSLNDIFKMKGKKFDFKTACMIGLNMVKCIMSVHNAGIIHRDVKPDNFCLASNGSDIN